MGIKGMKCDCLVPTALERLVSWVNKKRLKRDNMMEQRKSQLMRLGSNGIYEAI